eukprot:CAMPEP_0116134506 /NCGR_PEP_ID=MMETSP0329-20121206/10682_1 /TAXON_ID=697910 /ORGANISM="Pseudo-nitzschia arenysensis, Strain B593" /LENGTH=259 /DNA_ID=CAMNT_0003629221 /DNA_START=57 /DNA_END=832 /DNA_ORIENTATION=+
MPIAILLPATIVAVFTAIFAGTIMDFSVEQSQQQQLQFDCQSQGCFDPGNTPIESNLPAILAVIFTANLASLIAIVAFVRKENKRVDRRISAIENARRKSDIQKREDDAETNESDPPDQIASTEVELILDMDSEKKYQEAFIECGGDEALKRFEDASDDLQDRVLDKFVGKELEKLLPQSMDLTGASKVLVNQSYVRTLDELYEKGDKAHVLFKQAIEEIASQTNSKPSVPDTKGRDRAMQKALFKYSDANGKGVAYYR